MSKAPTHASRCTVCKGRGYALENRGGWVHAEYCTCFSCGKCDGSGRVFHQNERGVAYLGDCDCSVLKNRFKMLNAAGIPGKFADSSFENYLAGERPQKTAKSRAEDFIKDFRKSQDRFHRGLVFMGGPGLGKTHLCAAILKTLILEDGIDGKFVDFFQLLSDIRHAYSQDMSERTLIQPYIRSRVLVIDELAKGRNNEWELTVLDQFISSRYNAANSVTLFTTNYLNQPPGKNRKSRKEDGEYVDTSRKIFPDTFKNETLQDRIGSRIYSRVAEMSLFIKMEGADFRQNVKKPLSTPLRGRK
ncbi:MAG: ATP-binding protein [Nitrospinaceae bacterium]